MTITTAAELDALPHGAVVVDNHKCPWQKIEVTHEDLPGVTSAWMQFGKLGTRQARHLIDWGPLTVLSTDATTARNYSDLRFVGVG